LLPTRTKLRAELAERAERAGRFEQAVKEYQLLVTEAPQVRTYWRSISQCFAGLDRASQAVTALAPLIVAREATPEELRKYQKKSRVPGELTANSLSADELRRFEEGSPVAGVVVELLSALSVVLPKIFPVPFDVYGVTVRDKITARAPNTLRELADRIGIAFGAGEFDLYVHSLGRPLVSVEYSDVPALFVHADVAMRPKAEQVLLLGRALFNISRGTQLIDMLSPTDLEVLLASAVRNYESTFATELASIETLDAQAKRVSKAMPWFKGNRVEPAARNYAAAGVPVQHWILGAHLSAVRAAAMASDDLAASLSLLAGTGVDDRFVERVSSFLIAEPTQALRRRLFA
jgi:cellulose synthase operon protein C